VTNVRRGYTDTHGGVNRYPDGFVDTGMEGGAFWFRGPQNVVRDNLAVASFIGFNYNGYYLPDRVRVPTARGQHEEDRTPVDVLALGESRDNEAVAVGIGLWVTFPQGTQIEKATGSVFENYRLSNVYGSGVEMYHTAFVTLKNFTITADAAVSSRNEGDTAPRVERIGQMSTGVFAGHSAYENGGLVIRDCVIRGFNIGVSLPLNTLLGSKATATVTNPVRVLGGVLSNYVNVVASSPITRREVEVTGVTFRPTTVTRVGTLPATPVNVWMRFDVGNTLTAQGLFKPSTLKLNGRGVYYLEQRAAFVIPNVAGLLSGTAGKTNAEVWQLFGLAVAGGVAPTTNRQADVVGYIDP
jgi:hypothetical protein